MRRTVLLVVGAILGAALYVGAPSAVAAAPDPYSGNIATECTISVPAIIEQDERVRVRFSVDANSPTAPTGTVTVSIAADGDQVWTKTVPYTGGTQSVLAPELPKGPTYHATTQFHPDDPFLRCHAGELFAVESVSDNGDNDDNGPGGLLPDTGGPALLWLLLGAGLVGAGGGTLLYARRRLAPTTV